MQITALLLFAGTMILSLWASFRVKRVYRRYAEEELKKRLEPVGGVAAVKVAGGLEDEVQVLIDQDRLAQLNLDVNTVIERLRLENVNISGGRIEEGSQRYLVRTVNQFTGLDQMRELLVANVEGVPVRLRDVATVSQGYKEREAIIRLGGGEADDGISHPIRRGVENTAGELAGERALIARVVAGGGRRRAFERDRHCLAHRVVCGADLLHQYILPAGSPSAWSAVIARAGLATGFALTAEEVKAAKELLAEMQH